MPKLRNRISVYPDGKAMVFHDPFCATLMNVQVNDKGAAVLEREGEQYVFADVRLDDSIRLGDDEIVDFTARYAGKVPK